MGRPSGWRPRPGRGGAGDRQRIKGRVSASPPYGRAQAGQEAGLPSQGGDSGEERASLVGASEPIGRQRRGGRHVGRGRAGGCGGETRLGRSSGPAFGRGPPAQPRRDDSGSGESRQVMACQESSAAKASSRFFARWVGLAAKRADKSSDVGVAIWVARGWSRANASSSRSARATCPRQSPRRIAATTGARGQRDFRRALGRDDGPLRPGFGTNRDSTRSPIARRRSRPLRRRPRSSPAAACKSRPARRTPRRIRRLFIEREPTITRRSPQVGMAVGDERADPIERAAKPTVSNPIADNQRLARAMAR